MWKGRMIYSVKGKTHIQCEKEEAYIVWEGWSIHIVKRKKLLYPYWTSKLQNSKGEPSRKMFPETDTRYPNVLSLKIWNRTTLGKRTAQKLQCPGVNFNICNSNVLSTLTSKQVANSINRHRQQRQGKVTMFTMSIVNRRVRELVEHILFSRHFRASREKNETRHRFHRGDIFPGPPPGSKFSAITMRVVNHHNQVGNDHGLDRAGPGRSAATT